MRGPGRRRAPPDYLILAAALALLLAGIVMVYSASTIWAEQKLGRPLYFLQRHLIWAAISLTAMAFFARLDYHRLREALPWAYAATALLLLAALLFPPIAGVRRWIRLGPLSFQPAEAAKLTCALFLASYLDRNHSRLASPVRGLLVPMGAVGLLLALIGAAPDLGTPFLIFAASCLVLFVAGTPARWILGSLLAAAPVVAFELWRKPYRWARLMSFTSPFENMSGAGYQLAQALLAVGSGGWLGKGPGASQLKLMYLPTPHTDFIFPVLCEEWGLAGALAVLALFGLVLARGARAARLAPDKFGSLLACGIVFTLCLQAFFNMAMSVGLLPTKGIPLPFFSFGGSSLLVTGAGIGILLNISRQARHEEAA